VGGGYGEHFIPVLNWVIGDLINGVVVNNENDQGCCGNNTLRVAASGACFAAAGAGGSEINF
jgi:hypothetical protein